MAVVNLYQSTKLNSSNRARTIEVYNWIFGETGAEPYTIPKEITPLSSSVYLTSSGLRNDYDYLTFEYRGVKYGAFINAVVPLATADAYRIDFIVDWWYYTLANNIDFDIHGNCLRAHVNDFDYVDENGNFKGATLKNTLLSPEVQVSYSNSHKSSYYMSNTPIGLKYIYIYISNPSEGSGFNWKFFWDYDENVNDYIKDFYQIYKNVTDEDNYLLNNGLLICGVLTNDGYCYFLGEEELQKPLTFRVRLDEITSGDITSMYVSEVPPVKDASIKSYLYIDSLGQEFTCYYIDYGQAKLYVRDRELVVSGNVAIPLIEGFKTGFYVTKIFDGEYSFDMSRRFFNKNSVVTRIDNFNRYLNEGIVKSNSQVYNDVVYCNNIIDTINTDKIVIRHSIDGQYTYAILSNAFLSYNQAVIIEDFRAIFAPDTVIDFWTLQQAKITSLSLKNEEFNLYFGGATDIFMSQSSIVKAGFNVAGSWGTPQMGSAIAQAAETSVKANLDTAKSIVNMVQQGEILKEKKFLNDMQAKHGITRCVPTGYYCTATEIANFTLNITEPSFESRHKINTDLHRYGYITFLLLEDVLSNHKREKFNYIKAENIDIHGLSLEVANSISEMFENGVHLWNTYDVGNYNVANWQISAEEVIE